MARPLRRTSAVRRAHGKSFTNGSHKWNAENLLKGRIAETLVRELLTACWNRVYS
jgi:hypothetical protein